jgi:ferric-dicitrate binding protein FerR (iron transport regulator)
MGMNYTIDKKCRLVRSRGWGVLSTRDLQDLTSWVLADPRFDAEYRGLTDLTEVTEVTIDAMKMAESATAPTYIAGTRRAIVVTSDAVFGMACMFATLAERSGQVVRVFRDLSLAEAWLEL